jgi:hypothetical protein
VWALPFLTVLAPSERYHQELGKRHKQLTDWARQMVFQVRQWLPERVLVIVADSSYAALELLAACQGLQQPVTMVTRLRLDAALYNPAYAHPARRPGRPRKKGARQPTLEQRLSDPATTWQDTNVRWYGGTTRTVRLATGTAVWYHSGLPPVSIRWVLISDPEGKFESQALLSTDPEASPTQIVEWFVMRWQLEVTFEDGSGAPGHRDPTPVVGPGDLAHHTNAVGAVLARDTVRPSSTPRTRDASAAGGLVQQGVCFGD